jgi:hypothetical protein
LERQVKEIAEQNKDAKTRWDQLQNQFREKELKIEQFKAKQVDLDKTKTLEEKASQIEIFKARQEELEKKLKDKDQELLNEKAKRIELEKKVKDQESVVENYKCRENTLEIADLKDREAKLLKTLQEKERKDADWNARAELVKSRLIELKKSMRANQ